MYLFVCYHLFIFYYATLHGFDFQEIYKMKPTTRDASCISECHIFVLFVSQSKALHLACTTVEIKMLKFWDIGTSYGLEYFTTTFLVPGTVCGRRKILNSIDE